jgi:peptidoglycan hydrolase-like protein with peptidoglycan-binding domain
VESPPSVLEVQRLLDEQGYDPGPVDGIFGDRTARAIRSFQANNDLPVTGRVSATLLERLRRSGSGDVGAAGGEGE